MTNLRYIVFGVATLILAVGHPALAQDCSRDPSTPINRTQQDLYEYALIANVAYGKLPSSSNTCDLTTGTQIELPRWDAIEIIHLPLKAHSVLDKWNGQIKDYNLATYIDKDDITYLTCGYDNTKPQLALTWTEVTRTTGNEDAPSKLDVVLDVLVVTLKSMLPQNEELGVIRLKRLPSSTKKSEELVAFRGTDFTRIPQIMASVKDLLSSSCVFEFATRVVAAIGHDSLTGRLSVIGHSLGGAATQYVARDRGAKARDAKEQLTAEERERNQRSSRLGFRGYAFNSIGLDNSQDRNVDLSSLYSYYIDGEIVSWLGKRFGRKQAGTVVRYVPPKSWPKTGWLNFVKNVLRWEYPESVRRHRLPAVQQGLCECMNGRGSVE